MDLVKATIKYIIPIKLGKIIPQPIFKRCLSSSRSHPNRRINIVIPNNPKRKTNSITNISITSSKLLEASSELLADTAPFATIAHLLIRIKIAVELIFGPTEKSSLENNHMLSFLQQSLTIKANIVVNRGNNKNLNVEEERKLII